MKTVALGNSGAQVSVFCLGAMFFGTRNDEQLSYRLLDQYVDAGGAFIDTANIYAHWVPGGKGGESEVLLNRWMKARKNRDRLFIATKVGFEMPGVERGLRASQIKAECDKSLTRLGVDTIDLYYAHVDDLRTPMEETLEALDGLVKAGKVRFIGASNFSAWRLEEARWVSQTHGWAEYCCVQQRYSYLRPRPGQSRSFGGQRIANRDLREYCQARGITLLAYSALLGGAFTRADRSLSEQYVGPDSDARIAMLKAVAAECGATPNQVVLAWMVQHGIIPVMAAGTPEQMTENLGALDLTLSEDQMNRLDSAGG
jgi:aryl-alcohol dehydrogenase-like predicted oxidoreductase